MYKELTGDQSAATNLDQCEIEKMLIDMEDVDTVVNLRYLNSGRKSMYKVFWQECSKYIQEGIGWAVDDHRHQEVTHLATAVSVPGLISQVSKQCPEGRPIPSQSWVQLQFWPKIRRWHSSSLH